MKSEIYKCNLCGVAKGDVNHWFLGVNLPTSAIVTPWDAHDAEVSTIAHLCGSACVLKFVSGWLSGARGAIGKTVPLVTSAEISTDLGRKQADCLIGPDPDVEPPQSGAGLAGRPGTSKGAL